MTETARVTLDASDPKSMNKRMLAARIADAKPSPTAAISDEARRLRESGRNIINLGEGELDFPTPPHICDAAIGAIHGGETKYTAVAGTKELKQAISQKFQRDNNLIYNEDEIIVTAGAKQAIFNAFLATLEQHDEVIIPAPYWVSYPDIVSIAGGKPVIITCDENADFKLKPAQLEASITANTKWLVLNSPSNPTGAMYSQSELTALVEILNRHPHVHIIADDIYEKIVYDGQFTSIASISPNLRHRTLTVNGVSKCYSMTGWRVGYAGGPTWLIRAIETLQSQSTSNASSISQAATIAALNGDMVFAADWMARLLTRRDRLLTAISATNGILSAKPPNSAFYIFANCAGAIGKQTPDGSLIETDIDMASYLLGTAETAVIAGTAFGLSPYLRIAYAVDDALLETACDNIITACKSLT